MIGRDFTPLGKPHRRPLRRYQLPEPAFRPMPEFPSMRLEVAVVGLAR